MVFRVEPRGFVHGFNGLHGQVWNFLKGFSICQKNSNHLSRERGAVLPAELEKSLDGACDLIKKLPFKKAVFSVLPAGLEPATYCSASKRSNPLSYGSVHLLSGQYFTALYSEGQGA